VPREPEDEVRYLTVEEVYRIHDEIIEEDEGSTTGVVNEGNVEYALDFIRHGDFGQEHEAIHKKAAHLMLLIASGHEFADGNKRTALNATETFLALNGYGLEYGEEVRVLLRDFATEGEVGMDHVVRYIEEATTDK
jgi:death-on-curing protein